MANNFETILGNAGSLNTGFIVLEHDLYQQSVSLAIEFVLPYALSLKQFTIQPIIQCLGKTLADSYVETATNATITGGSTGTGSLSALPSVTVVGSQVVNAASQGAGSGSSTAAKGGASVVAFPSIALAVALVALVARLA